MRDHVPGVGAFDGRSKSESCAESDDMIMSDVGGWRGVLEILFMACVSMLVPVRMLVVAWQRIRGKSIRLM